MDTIAIITKARQSPQVTELFTRICDFEFVEPGGADIAVQLQSGHHPNMIAQDASGGIFALCQINDTGRQPVLYISSEDEAGIIARDLPAALQIVIQLRIGVIASNFLVADDLTKCTRPSPILNTTSARMNR